MLNRDCYVTACVFIIFQNPDMRQKYFRLKDMNEHMLKQLENGQQELDVLNSKIEGLQEVCWVYFTCSAFCFQIFIWMM